MSFLKNIVLLICLIFESAAVTEFCPASGKDQINFHEVQLYRDVKPKVPSLKEVTTPGRSLCAVNCYRRLGCRSIFYSTTDNVCLLYGEDVFHSALENYPGMRRIDVVLADCYDVVKKGIQTDGVYLVQPRDGGQPISVYYEISNGGWLVFQRRTDGSIDFYRTWNEYKDSFGNLSNEFWLVQNCSDFITKDKDRDTYQWNCALDYKAGWWLYSCSHSSLNLMCRNGTTAEYIFQFGGIHGENDGFNP